MEYRLLKRDEIDTIGEIDRTETIEYIYYDSKGKLKLVKEFCEVTKWSHNQEQIHISSLYDIYDRDGFIFGAFDESKIVGVISLDNEFIGMDKDQLNLAGFWVSKQYRRIGVGKTLLKMVEEKARELGAKKLYVSATPSKNTVEFYMNRGFCLADEIIEKLYELEPEDIHMVRMLN